MSSSWYDDFVMFRAAIERAVGRVWNDDAFKAAFLKDPLQAMENQFGYRCPFHIAMRAKECHDKFEPTYTGGWVGGDDGVRFYLPPPPKDPRQRAEALAAFNQARIVFLAPKPEAE